ncbi:MAG: GNAT family N-acetyltransferase [Solirubrobacteraceae bacterium]
MDAPVVAELITQLGYPTTVELAEELLASFARDPSSRVQVAEISHRVVGLVATHIVPRLDSDRCSCRIVDLVVASGSKRMGVGRLLVAAAESEARRQGAERVDLSTGEWRQDAHLFYDQLGFNLHSRGLVKRLSGV